MRLYGSDGGEGDGLFLENEQSCVSFAMTTMKDGRQPLFLESAFAWQIISLRSLRCDFFHSAYFRNTAVGVRRCRAEGPYGSFQHVPSSRATSSRHFCSFTTLTRGSPPSEMRAGSRARACVRWMCLDFILLLL